MKATNLEKNVKKLGGSATITTTTSEHRGYADVLYLRTTVNLTGTLNGYDIEMNANEDGETDFFTVRHISKRGTFDAGSDYNSGDYIFCNRIKDLTWATNLN